MKLQKGLNNDKGIISILDLPEQIFREIFQHISTHELFSTVRNLNQDLKQYVEDYLSLLGVFLLIGYVPTLVIYILKKGGNKFVAHSFVTKPFPMFDHISNINVENAKLNLFPFSTISTCIQGHLLFGVHSRVPSRFGGRWNRSIFDKVAVDLYGFNVEKCYWRYLETRYADINSRIIACSAISDSTLLMFQSTNVEGMGYRLKLISICVESVLNSFSTVFSGQRRLNIPEEVQRLSGFSLLNLTNNSIVLIGGRYVYCRVPSGSIVLNRVMWQGTLTDGNTKIAWNPIDIGGSCMGYNPICFKLKENVYITGDRKHCTSGNNHRWHLTCPSCIRISNTFDRYNYKEKKMYLNAHSIPNGLSKMEHPAKIVTDKNETFAVLVFKQVPPQEGRINCKLRMLIFTEEGGFVQVDNYEKFDNHLGRVLNLFFKYSALVCIDNLSDNYLSIQEGI